MLGVECWSSLVASREQTLDFLRSASSGSHTKWKVWWLMGVGGLVVGAGGWSLSLHRALRLKGDFSNAGPRRGVFYIPQLEQSGNMPSYSLAWVNYALGG